MDWCRKIRNVLRRQPLHSGELIEGLGFDGTLVCLDNMLSRMIGGSFRGSWVESEAQQALSKMVANGSVRWWRAANNDNWYALPGQRRPRGTAPRKRTLRALVRELLARPQVSELVHPDHRVLPEADDCWYEFTGRYSAVSIIAADDGWELTDADLVCNGCGETFSTKYPMDVPMERLAKRIVRGMRRQERQEAAATLAD